MEDRYLLTKIEYKKSKLMLFRGRIYQKSAVKPRASARGYKAPNRGYSGFQCIV